MCLEIPHLFPNQLPSFQWDNVSIVQHFEWLKKNGTKKFLFYFLLFYFLGGTRLKLLPRPTTATTVAAPAPVAAASSAFSFSTFWCCVCCFPSVFFFFFGLHTLSLCQFYYKLFCLSYVLHTNIINIFIFILLSGITHLLQHLQNKFSNFSKAKNKKQKNKEEGNSPQNLSQFSCVIRLNFDFISAQTWCLH